MVTPVGTDAAQTASSVRAGIARLSETAIHDRRFNPVVMGTLTEDDLPPLEPAVESVRGLTSRQARMLRLAGPALREAVGAAAAQGVPLLLGLPEALPDRPLPAGERFLELLIQQSGVEFELAASVHYSNGRAAGLLALAQAAKLIESGKATEVIVGGVDTYFDLYLLATLDAESRILAEGVMDGFVPGEGAAFLRVSSATDSGLAGPPLARVSGTVTAKELGHRYSQEPYRGDGLAECLQAAFSSNGAAATPVQSVFAGLNGESFGAKEWGTAQLRSKKNFAGDFLLFHPVDCFGDAGAALGPILLGLGAIGIHQGYLPAPCLVWCSSDREERGAAILSSASA
jgi:3-oxoacyl-[acyl-carrier-protein] synthase-1